MKNTKTKLISSVTVLLICFAMLIGSTFAWFTDSASTGVNKIQAGNLDVKLSVMDKVSGGWTEVSEATELFEIGADNKWEPGVVAYEKFKVENVGTLALDYSLGFLPANVTYAGVKSLLDVIKVYVVQGEADTNDRDALLGTISAMGSSTIDSFYQSNVEIGAGGSKVFTIVLYWEPTSNDNDYNLQGTPLEADLGIELVAKQARVEFDSFGNDYDSSSMYPVNASINIAGYTNTDTNGNAFTNRQLTVATTAKDSNSNPIAKATIPNNAAVEGSAQKLTLSIEEIATPANVTISSGSNSKTLEISLDGLSSSNTQLIRVETNIGAGLGNVTLTHVKNGVVVNTYKKNSAIEVIGDQDYHYDDITGILTLISSSFSPFVIEYPKDSWANHHADSYTKEIDGVTYITSAEELALFAKQVNETRKADCFKGKTFVLDADLDLGEYLWNPIGQTGYGQFAGTFDGNYHTIKNLYINNTDDSKDPATGLFGWLNTATVKNLTIDGANVTGHHNVGVIAGYLENPSKIENGCNIINCHVNDAIVSCTGVNDDANGDKCGGIVGHAGNVGVKVQDCTVKYTSISAGRDAGQVVGAAKEANVSGCSATDVTVTANRTSSGENIREEVIGRILS